ncbi:MAG: hypothetical protein KatS3mg069_1882 [Meiothermus sp.]|nr:MAG: hypothetical protein KatS3mg069_1882 [Meiothermus sp.]
MGKSLALPAVIGSPETSSPVYQQLRQDPLRSFFVGVGRFPVAALTQGCADKKAFTQGLAGRASRTPR